MATEPSAVCPRSVWNRRTHIGGLRQKQAVQITGDEVGRRKPKGGKEGSGRAEAQCHVGRFA
ncbi:hypothetical protein GGTG_00782 [Gaeumannomyces tritici R3-111a-1]|uniref:Uncharacterized protein n=1 Tax=Gaeumannomyces tritici (strain R3-111a-1) TaxID=644352 RepID=J3NHP5_GAET3|nr:hypothetical protein GGTG_00782 [Gaeumannomyces tritici R3-111a-1]EJT80788.1 hypothetical protein GGTG_00782 [Gaeumannomyces tritici R3-111a-1]